MNVNYHQGAAGMSNETMTDARALEVLQGRRFERCAEYDEAFDHIAARLRGEAAPCRPFVGCQCPTCGEEFIASSAPDPVAGDAVAKLLRVWETPPTKAGPGWIESNARRDCARQMRAALAQDRINNQ